MCVLAHRGGLTLLASSYLASCSSLQLRLYLLLGKTGERADMEVIVLLDRTRKRYPKLKRKRDSFNMRSRDTHSLRETRIISVRSLVGSTYTTRQRVLSLTRDHDILGMWLGCSLRFEISAGLFVRPRAHGSTFLGPGSLFLCSGCFSFEDIIFYEGESV